VFFTAGKYACTTTLFVLLLTILLSGCRSSEEAPMEKKTAREAITITPALPPATPEPAKIEPMTVLEKPGLPALEEIKIQPLKPSPQTSVKRHTIE